MRYVITTTDDAHGTLAVRVECAAFVAIVSDPWTSAPRVRFERAEHLSATLADHVDVEAEADLSALADAAIHLHALGLG